MWSTIDNVIKNLQYISDPDITIPSNSNKFKHQTSKEYDNKGNAYTYGWIFGLKEGEEISVDDVTLVGMIVNETKGDYIVVEESALGSGTGTKVDGYIDRDVRFSYKCILYGDVNGDARIDGTDWAKVSYYVLTKNMAEEHIMEAANADHQKGLTVADADLIKAHYNYSKTIDQNVSSQGTGTTGL
jgi:hypothetical protein